jgi:hypothetical protein
VDINIVDRDTGAILPTHARDGKLYIAGTPGHRYSVRMINHSGRRVLTVLSVDGVNAISGETASANQSGYVLSPYESAEIAGWRKSMSEIAQFNFTALSNSYAARTGRPDNVGVIGVAVYREKEPVWREGSVLDKSSADSSIADRAAPARSEQPGAAPPLPTAAAAPAQRAAAEAEAGAAAGNLARADALGAEKRRASKLEESLGTGHGARETSNITYTAFERASAQPDEVVSVWYDSYRNLVARGVIPQPPQPRSFEPQAFPGGFVPDPAS